MSLTAIAFALAFAAGLGLALFKHPLYGLYTYIAVFYLHPPSRWWGNELPDLRWSLLAAFVMVIATLGQKVDPQRPPWYSDRPAKVLIFFTVWLWIQNAWALSSSDQLSLSVLYTKYVLLYYVIYRLVDTREKILWFILTHIAGCLYLGWVAFSTTVHGRLEGVGGPGIDESNALAMQMGTGITVAAMLLLTEKGWRWWFCLLAIPFMLNTVIDAQSRGAFLALICAGAVLWYLKPPTRAKLFYAFAALGVVLLLALGQRFFWERMGTMVATAEDESNMDRSVEGRLVLVEAQIKMARRYPLGAGHRGTAVLSPQYIDEYYLSRSGPGGEATQRSSHNTFFTALVEQGIPGAIMYIALWLWVVLELLKYRRDYANRVSLELAGLIAGIGGALAMIGVAGMFVDYIKAEVQIWMFVLLAIGMHLVRHESASAAKRTAPLAAATQPPAAAPYRSPVQRRRHVGDRSRAKPG